MSGELTLQLEIADDAPTSAFDPHVAQRLAELALERCGISSGAADLGVHIVDEATIRELNRDHRGKDAATDVLSFPIDGIDPLPPGISRQLGDIFVCPGYVERQLSDGSNIGAGEDATLARAIERCIVHGMLHLLGMDHEGDADADAMRDREDELLAALDEAPR